MKTTKERLATAIHTSLNETLSFYKTSLTGLTEEQVEKNRDLYGENTITKGQEDSILKKDLRIHYQSFHNHFACDCLYFSRYKRLACQTWPRGPYDLYYYRCLGFDFRRHPFCPRVAERQGDNQSFKNDCQHCNCYSRWS